MGRRMDNKEDGKSYKERSRMGQGAKGLIKKGKRSRQHSGYGSGTKKAAEEK